MEANSDETFREVAKRMKAKFPRLAVVDGKRRSVDPGDGEDDDDLDLDARGGDGGGDDDLDRDQDQHRRRAPAANLQDRGNNGNRRNSGNRRTLTQQEIGTMKKVGMNPDNDKDVVQFLREAVAMEQSA